MIRPTAALLVALAAAPAAANVPAAFWACEGAEHGDPCRMPGGYHGNCLLDTLCEDDDPDTEVNECLICRDGCGAQEPGTGCVRRDGSHGVCVAQDPAGCTDLPETSFDECNRCEAGEPPPVPAEDAGCAATDAAVAAPWALLLLAAALQLRRR